jgi:plastocyanin domain-containing protein
MVLSATAFGCKSSADTSQRAEANAEKVTADSGNVKVTVSDHGFAPSSIQAKRGQPLTLQFTRVSDQTCAKQVAFPELNLTKDLPLNTVVTIQVPTDVARTLTFQCGMGMYKSSVVIL